MARRARRHDDDRAAVGGPGVDRRPHDGARARGRRPAQCRAPLALVFARLCPLLPPALSGGEHGRSAGMNIRTPGPLETIEPELSEDVAARRQGLRTGWTTGTCASAATKAAAIGLVHGAAPASVEVALPGGDRVAFPVIVEGPTRCV